MVGRPLAAVTLPGTTSGACHTSQRRRHHSVDTGRDAMTRPQRLASDRRPRAIFRVFFGPRFLLWLRLEAFDAFPFSGQRGKKNEKKKKLTRGTSENTVGPRRSPAVAPKAPRQSLLARSDGSPEGSIATGGGAHGLTFFFFIYFYLVFAVRRS